MKPEDLPFVSPALVAYLEKTYRDRSPELKDSDREIWYKAGQVSVVAFLRAVSDKQAKGANKIV